MHLGETVGVGAVRVINTSLHESSLLNQILVGNSTLDEIESNFPGLL